jgi:hypothetical protein
MSVEAEATSPPLARDRAGWLDVVRGATAGVLSGAIAGALAGGIGGRMAMRVTALMATNAEQGTRTEAEEIVGEITLGGTLGLVLFGGVAVGIVGGLIYAVLARWFEDAGRWRGAVFGTYLLLTLGWSVIEGDNFDFSILGSLTVNVLMFGAIFVLFGVLVAPLDAWTLEALPAPGWSLGGALSLPLYALGALFTLAAAGLIVGMFGEDGAEAPFYAIIPTILIIGGLAVTWFARRGERRFDRLSDLRGAPRALALAVVLVPLVMGVGLGAHSLAEMVREAYR